MEALIVNPGFVKSQLYDKTSKSRWRNLLAWHGSSPQLSLSLGAWYFKLIPIAMPIFGVPPQHGALSSLYAATAPELTGVHSAV